MNEDLEQLTDGKSDCECAIICSAHLEKVIEANFHGADGHGLGQKAASLEGKLPAAIIDRLRYVGGIRNKAAHSPLDFDLKNRKWYISECESLLNELNITSSRASPGRAGVGFLASFIRSDWSLRDLVGGTAERVPNGDRYSWQWLLALVLSGIGGLWFVTHSNPALADLFEKVSGHSLDPRSMAIFGVLILMIFSALAWRSRSNRVGVMASIINAMSRYTFLQYIVAAFVGAGMTMVTFWVIALVSIGAIVNPVYGVMVGVYFIVLTYLFRGQWPEISVFWRVSFTLVPIIMGVLAPWTILSKAMTYPLEPAVISLLMAMLLSPLFYVNFHEQWTSWKAMSIGLVWGAIGCFFVGSSMASDADSVSSASAANASGGVVHVNQWIASNFTFMEWLPFLIFGAVMYMAIRRWRRKTRLPGNSAASKDDFVSEYRPVRSRKSFSIIAGMSELKAKLLSAGREAKTGGRNGILLYGDPGNGKTMFAEALAGELGLPLLKVSIADIKSRWIGETTERLVGVMNAAGRRPCVLFFDEVESVIPPRDNNMRSDTEEPKITAAFLTMINDLREKCGVVIVAATNYLQMVDPAAIREGRFDWRIEITAPDQEARVALLASTVSGFKIGGTVLDSAAARLSGYSAAKVISIGKEAVAAHSSRNTPLSLDDFVTAQKTLSGSSGDGVGENAPGLDQLILGDSLTKQLTSLVIRMRDPAAARAKGATIPTGVIFHGDPGNGKTMAARAIGKETGWGFLSVTGADLMKEDAVKKLLKRANDIRPCIIFLDEADGVLADRDSWQAKTDAINSLLTAMDGSSGRMTDIIWIAATNRLEAIDHAMLRGGRFSEKIFFPNPDAKMLESAISGWLSGIKLKIVFSITEAVEVLDGLSFSTAREALQTSVNHAIGLEKNDLALEDLRFARNVVSSHT